MAPAACVDALRDYTLAPYAAAITRPTLVCSAEGDDISASAKALAAASTCEHEYLVFAETDGAADHCEAGARVVCQAGTFQLARPTSSTRPGLIDLVVPPGAATVTP